VLHLFSVKPLSRFRSVDDVKNCGIAATAFCLPKGDASENFWLNAIEPSRNGCRKLSLEEDQPVRIEGSDPFSEGFNALTEKKTCEFFLASTGTLTVASEGPYCNRAEVVGEPFYPLSTSFILPKGSNYTVPMSEATLRLQQQDRVPSPIKYGVAQECKKQSQTQLTWETLQFFFYFAYGVLFLWVLGTCILCLVRKKRHDRRENDNERAGLSDAVVDS
jgi:hypothetical protein